MIAAPKPGPTDIAGFDPYANAPGDCYYDADAAERSVRFFSLALTHVKGPLAGEKFELAKWQADVNRTLFGWKRADGSRRFRVVFVGVPRKNGKSTWAAGNALYALTMDREGGAECYCAAENREQASLVFDMAAGMVRKCDDLDGILKIRDSQKRIVLQRDNAVLRAIPANEGGSHGFNSHYINGDELHAWPGREFYDVLHTSTGARSQPIEFYITTAGHDKLSICHEVYSYAKSVRDGKINDPTFLPVVYEAEECDDWTSPKVWEKANPNLGVSVARDYIERECEKAKQNPAYENTFRRLHLNQWTSQESRWIPMHHWNACETTDADIDPRHEAVGGLDMAATSDFTAWSIVQHIDGVMRVRTHFWLPAEKAAQYARQYNFPMEAWKRAGLITIIPGARIDHSYVKRRVLDDCAKYGIDVIGEDPWNMEQLRQDLEESGLLMVDVRQGYGSLSAPSKQLMYHILGHTLDHGANPILDWQAENAVCKEDENGNVRPVKDSGKSKIDGLVATIIAEHAYVSESAGLSMYAPGAE